LIPGSVATAFSATAKREGVTNRAADSDGQGPREIGYSMTPEEVASVIVAMLEQSPQAWMSEVTLRPLNLELRRTQR
jgi:hypothetical protein